MKPIKIATLSLTSVHAGPYIVNLPLNKDKFDWVAASINPKDRDIPDLQLMPDYVKVYDTDEEMLKAHPDLEAVVLCGSNDLTYKQFKLCTSYGIKNFLIMKVPTLSMEEYDDMLRIAKENDMIIQVELEMRGDQTVNRLKQLCDTGAIGKLLSIQIYNTTVVLPPEILPWVTDPKQSYGRVCQLKPGDSRFRGGALTDHPHAFDLSRYFSGSEFESIYAEVCENFREGNKIEEGVFVVGKMKNGVCVTIDPSYSRHENKLPPIKAVGPGWEGYPKRVEVYVTLSGEKGTIMADCMGGGVYHTGLPYNTFAYEYPEGPNHYTAMLGSFAECVRNHIKPYVNIEMHQNNMKAVNACYESIYTGKQIKL